MESFAGCTLHGDFKGLCAFRKNSFSLCGGKKRSPDSATCAKSGLECTPAVLGPIVLIEEMANFRRSGADPFLDAAHQFVFLALGIGEIVVG